MVSEKKKILFITWDGPQVNYLESLFLPIFNRVNKKGFEFHVIQYTWGAKKNTQSVCEKSAIPYRRIRVNRKFGIIGLVLTLITSYFLIKRYVKKEGIHIVMPRSVFVLPVVVRLKRRFGQLKLAFDADGLPLDERIDTKEWNPQSIVYRILRDVEYRGLINSDIVLTRSNKASQILHSRSGLAPEKFVKVTNGRDVNSFNIQKENSLLKKSLGFSDDHRIVTYLGSIGSQYCIPEMINFVKVLRKYIPAKMLILTHQVEEARSILESSDLSPDEVVIKSIEKDEISNYLSITDLGLAFRRPTFSMQAVSPLKLAEYLLCGVPVVSSKRIGDSETILNDLNHGILIDFSNEEYHKAANWFTEKIFDKKNIRELGIQNFDLNRAIEEYSSILSVIS